MNESARVVQAFSSSQERTAPDVRPSMTAPVPTSLAREVWIQGERLVVSGQPLPYETVIPHVLASMLVVFPTLIATILGFAFAAEVGSIAVVLGTVLLGCAVAFGSTVAMLGHVIWFAIGTSVAFGPNGYRTRIPLAPRRRTSRLVLRGRVGFPLEIVGDRGVVFEKLPQVHGPWQVAHVFWLAHQLAHRMGVPLEVQVDEAAWNRWAVDPSYRAQVAFEARVSHSKARYAEWYRVPATEPQGVDYQPEGLLWRGVMVEKRGLRTKRFGVAWSHVYDAEVELYEYGWTDGNGIYHQETKARLLVRTHDDVKQLLSLKASPSSVGALQWLRDHLQQHAGRVVDHGSLADVPEELLAARNL